jgi:cytochrome P450
MRKIHLKKRAPGIATTLPPGPRGLATLRFLGFGAPREIITYFRETAKRFGPIASFSVLGQRVVLLDDADFIGDVLQHQQHRFVRDTGAVLLRELVGDGVLTTEDPPHLRRRRILQPAFHRARVAGYARAMVEEAERTGDAWSQRAEIDAGVEMTRLTLAVVGTSLFGAEVGDAAATIAGVIESVANRGGKLQPFLAALAPLLVALRGASPRPTSLVFGRERAALERVVDPIVAAGRRATPAELAARGDLLAMLLEARDEAGQPLGDDDIRNELITMVLAGHETTASALTWAWYLLARHPDAAERMHAELDALLAGGAPTVDDVPRLQYTSAVFNEALRLYPPASAFGRRPLEDVVIGGYRIPKGTSVFVSPYVTHRNPRYFPDPDAFVPERWLTGDPPPRFAFFPFGGGSKMCIGEPFARTEGVLVLASLARRYNLAAVDPQPLDVNGQGLLRPDRPVKMRPSRRVPAIV